MNAKMKIAGVLFGSLLVCTAACKKDDKEADKGKEKDTSGKVTTDKDKTKEPDKTTEPAKTLTGEEIAAFYESCWGHFNDKKWDAFKACFADDVVSEAIDSGQPPTTTSDATVAYAKTFVEAFPDIKGTAQLVLVNGNNVVGVWHIAGTHTAPLKGMGPQEIPATNQKLGQLMVHGIEVNAAGKAAKEWSLFDGGSFMGQLGLLPKEVPFRAAQEPGEKVVAIAKNDDNEKKNLEAYKAGIEAFNKHDLEAVKAGSADNLVWSEQAAPKDQNKTEMLEGLAGMWKAFSDVKLEPAAVWAAGDYVVASGTMVGTNDGDMPAAGLKKTGKKITMQYVEINRFKDGKVEAGWLFFNSAAMAQQMGLMDPKPADDKKSK